MRKVKNKYAGIFATRRKQLPIPNLRTRLAVAETCIDNLLDRVEALEND